MRKKRPIKKYQQPDNIHFSSPLVKRLVTKIMWDGKKNKAWKIVYQVDENLKKDLGFGIDKALEEAVDNLKIEVGTAKVRLGGTSQLVPKKIESEKSIRLALVWLVKAARNKGGKMFWFLLAQEIKEARQKSGEAYKRKKTEQQKASDSIAFASFAVYRS